jgi:hypothetical protein
MWLRKNSQRVIPKGWVCPRNLFFLEFGDEKQIPRFARDDKKALFPQPVEPIIKANPYGRADARPSNTSLHLSRVTKNSRLAMIESA